MSKYIDVAIQCLREESEAIKDLIPYINGERVDI